MTTNFALLSWPYVYKMVNSNNVNQSLYSPEVSGGVAANALVLLGTIIKIEITLIIDRKQATRAADCSLKCFVINPPAIGPNTIPKP